MPLVREGSGCRRRAIVVAALHVAVVINAKSDLVCIRTCRVADECLITPLHLYTFLRLRGPGTRFATAQLDDGSVVNLRCLLTV